MFKFTYFIESVNYMLGKIKYEAKYYVSHHAALPIFFWFIVKYTPGGHATFFAFINSFAHIISFGYFVVIGIFPKLKKYTKKYWPTAHTVLQVGYIFRF